MNQYLLTLVLKNDLDEKGRKEVLSIVEKDSKITKTDEWGNKDLTYPIKKQSKGFYIHLELDADPSKVATIDKNLKLEEDILRYLLIRV